MYKQLCCITTAFHTKYIGLLLQLKPHRTAEQTVTTIIVAVSHVFRGDLEGVKIMAPILLMIWRITPLIARMMMVCLMTHPLVPVVSLSQTILPVLVWLMPPLHSVFTSF